MINLNKDINVNSTKELTIELADSIVQSFLKYGTSKRVFTAADTDYDYKNVLTVSKEIDRIINLTKATASSGGKLTSVKSDLITVKVITDYVLDGMTWTNYKKSFEVELE